MDKNEFAPDYLNKKFCESWKNSNSLNYYYLENIDGPNYLEVSYILSSTLIGVMLSKIRRLLNTISRFRISVKCYFK